MPTDLSSMKGADALAGVHTVDPNTAPYNIVTKDNF